jgi:hypothetical protein
MRTSIATIRRRAAAVGAAVALTALAAIGGAQAAQATPRHLQAAPAAPSIEVNPAALKPPSQPPAVSKATTVAAKTLKGSPHRVPTVGGVSTQATTACATWPTKACYFYDGGLQNATGTGLYANLMVNWSYTDVKTRDAAAHNVTELAAIRARSGGLRDIVEVGTISDRSISPTGSDDPIFFVGAWVNGVFQGYNTGFVNYTGSGACAYHPGDSMGAINGTARAFGIEYINTAGTAVGWWASNGSQWCGYFPADPAGGSTATNLWFGSGANFTSTTQGQAFGEVTSQFNQPCTDMGNGTAGNAATGSPYNYNTMPSYISTVSWAGGSPVTSLTAIATPAGPPFYQQFLTGSVKTFYYGGTGWNNTGGLPGTRGSC